MKDLVNSLIDNHNKAVFNDPLFNDRVNDFLPYTDEKGITHIHVSDLDTEYALCEDGQWREVAPF